MGCLLPESTGVAAVSVLQAWVKRFQQEAGTSATPCKTHIPECAVVGRYLKMYGVVPVASTPTVFTRRQNKNPVRTFQVYRIRAHADCLFSGGEETCRVFARICARTVNAIFPDKKTVSICELTAQTPTYKYDRVKIYSSKFAAHRKQTQMLIRAGFSIKAWLIG